MRSEVVLIGGPAAAGKTTTVRLLAAATEAQVFRPADAFMELANIYGIRIADAFSLVNAREAEDLFLERCASSRITVADVHYAIQPTIDSAFAAGERRGSGAEAYVASMSERLFRALTAKFKVTAVLLVAGADTLFARAKARDGSAMRAASLEAVRQEVDAEFAEWRTIAALTGIDSLKVNTEGEAPEAIVAEILDRLTGQ